MRDDPRPLSTSPPKPVPLFASAEAPYRTSSRIADEATSYLPSCREELLLQATNFQPTSSQFYLPSFRAPCAVRLDQHTPKTSFLLAYLLAWGLSPTSIGIRNSKTRTNRRTVRFKVQDCMSFIPLVASFSPCCVPRLSLFLLPGFPCPDRHTPFVLPSRRAGSGCGIHTGSAERICKQQKCSFKGKPN